MYDNYNPEANYVDQQDQLFYEELSGAEHLKQSQAFIDDMSKFITQSNIK